MTNKTLTDIVAESSQEKIPSVEDLKAEIAQLKEKISWLEARLAGSPR